MASAEDDNWLGERGLYCASQVFQHLLSVALGFNVIEDVLDFAVRPDHECSPSNSLHHPAVHVFFFDHAVGFADFFVRVT